MIGRTLWSLLTHFLTGACIGRARAEPQDGLCHAGRGAGLGSRRPGHSVVARRPGGGAEAPSRHHAYVHRRASVGRGGRFGCLAASSLARGRRKRRLAESREHCPFPILPGASAHDERGGVRVEVSHPSRKNKDAARVGHSAVFGEPARGLLQPLNWGWLYLTALIARVEPPAAGLGQQLRPAAFLPLQSALVCGQFRFYRRAGDLGTVVAGPDVPWLMGLMEGEIGARRKPFRGRGWQFSR